MVEVEGSLPPLYCVTQNKWFALSVGTSQSTRVWNTGIWLDPVGDGWHGDEQSKSSFF